MGSGGQLSAAAVAVGRCGARSVRAKGEGKDEDDDEGEEEEEEEEDDEERCSSDMFVGRPVRVILMVVCLGSRRECNAESKAP